MREPDTGDTASASGPGIWRPVWWIAAGLSFALVSLWLADGPRSPFWWAEFGPFLLMALLFNRTARTRPVAHGWRAAAIYVALSWAFGMLYELTLTVDGSGIGGVHPETRASFLLAQGDYVLIALAGWLAIRWLRLDAREAFFLAGGISLTEGLIFTGVLTGVVLSPFFWMAPLFLAYYTMVYATFIALPAQIVGPEALWADGQRHRRWPVPALWLLGFVVAFAIRIVWGLGWAPFAEWAFSLPPNPLP